MGIINFLPIQEGTGTPSTSNVRPIRAPLNIDGIGEIWGGEFDNVAKTIKRKYFGITVSASDISKRHSLVSDVFSKGVSDMSWYFSSFNVPYASAYVSGNTDGYCSHMIYVVNNYYFGQHVQAQTSTFNIILDGVHTIDSFTQWFEDNGPVQIVYPVQTDTVYTLNTAQFNQAFEQLKTYYNGELPVTQMTEIRKRIIMNEPHLVTPASTGFHTFSTNMVAPLKECRINFSPVQEGEGDPSPENVRPITGWTDIKINRTGKNICPVTTGAELKEMPIVSSSRTVRLERFPQDTTFAMTCVVTKDTSDGTSHRLYFNGVTISGKFVKTGVAGNKSAVTNTPGSNGFISVSHNATGLNDVYPYIENIQVEVGSTGTEFEPYKGQTISVDWTNDAGTVYGGYVDLVNGVLVSDLIQFTILDSEWGYQSTVHSFYRALSFFPDASWMATSNSNFYGLCDTYRFINYNNCIITNNTTAVRNDANAKRIYVRTDGTDVTTPGDVTYVLRRETPLVYQLDPVTIKTLRGINNIWSNANGEIELSYWTH